MRATAHTLVFAVAALGSAVTLAQSGGREARIDGSSAPNFEASVAHLQQGLSGRRRDDFESALAIVWMTRSLGPRGLDRDGDGDVDLIDSHWLVERTTELLSDIQRGDLLASIEKRARAGDEYTAADYMRELDGLGYDEVLSLAGPLDVPSSAPKPSQRPRGSRTLSSSDEHGIAKCGMAGQPAQFCSPATAQAFAAAIEALNRRDYATARTALEKLDGRKLSPYERSKVEQLLASLSYTEGKLAEARGHLQNAVNAGGLNEQEVTSVLVQIRVVDGQLAKSTPQPAQ
ncbi:MAG TPA: hypothetical protein VFO94_08165 [Gammaproteobacteria bacterium]|nr:hypothetical protein [Gammaproteobacteria bacterium]